MPLFSKNKLRQQLAPDVAQGEALRDTQGALDSIPLVIQRTLTGVYTEPMSIGTLPKKPEAIECINVIDQATQEKPVLCGGLCHFIWKPQNGGASITSIDGLSSGLGKSYRFTFRITFAQG